MFDEEVLRRLQAENEQLRGELGLAVAANGELQKVITELQKKLGVLEQRIAELEGGADRHPPSFIKPNRPKPKATDEPRRKRDKEHNHGRKRDNATRSVRHAVDRCPECSYQLWGESIDYSRQVIELPAPQSIEVIEHQVIRRYCPKCERWRSPKLDLTGQVFGQGRMGVHLTSLIAYLRHALRVPVRGICAYLQAVHKLTISIGEIVELLHQVREQTQGTVEGLKEQVRTSSVVYADETGWREDGRNGYIWSFSTVGEEAVRYYEYDPSRAQAVVKRILGEKSEGHLVSDFYCGYNEYVGPQQRCWVHNLRDLHELKEKHSTEPDVVDWAEKVRSLYEDAKAWEQSARAPTKADREAQYVELVGKVHALGMAYTWNKGHPCWAMAKRLLRHEAELFQFVLVAGVSADNNLAERSIRPMVVIRKVSGGTRSDAGTKTRMALASLFQTWSARGLNPFDECDRLLSQPAATTA